MEHQALARRQTATTQRASTAGPRPAGGISEMLNGTAAVQRLERLGDGLNKAPNRTGLPDGLKAGVERLSGLSMDNVRLHRNSPKPAQLQAHAFTQGNDIHLAPGQDRHLPHEAWHVVQQAQGRVRPTMQLRGVGINDDAGLEREADAMGERAASASPASAPVQRRAAIEGGTVQRQLNFVGQQAGDIDQLYQAFDGDNVAFQLIVGWEADRFPRQIANLQTAIGQIRALVALYKQAKRMLAVFDGFEQRHAQHQLRGERNDLATGLLGAAKPIAAHLKRLVETASFDVPQRTAQMQLLTDVLEKGLAKLFPLERQWAVPNPVAVPHQAPFVEVPWDNEDLTHLRGMKANLRSPNDRVVKSSIDKLRGKDDEVPRFPPARNQMGRPGLKGAILYEHIKNSRRAIMDLVVQLGDSVALFSLERGGSFLADLIADFRNREGYGRPIPNVKIPKSAGYDPELEDYSRKKHHQALVMSMMDTEEGMMFRILARRPQLLHAPPMITIALAETAVSGASVKTLLKTLGSYNYLLPQSRFNVLVERQTIKETTLARIRPGGMRGGGMHFGDPQFGLGELGNAAIDKVRMFVSHVEYILGEDVGYQISYKNAVRGQPLLVFDEQRGEIVAAKLENAGLLPRDLLRMVISGAFDQALRAIFES